MNLSHGERNQKMTDGIFGVLNNLEKQNKYLFKFSANCKSYAGLKELAEKLDQFLKENNEAINMINNFIDLVNSEEGHYMDPILMDEIFKQTWETGKRIIKRVMEVRNRIIKAVDIIHRNKEVQKEILNTYKMKGWKGCRKAKNIYEVIDVTYEKMLLVEPQK